MNFRATAHLMIHVGSLGGGVLLFAAKALALLPGDPIRVIRPTPGFAQPSAQSAVIADIDSETVGSFHKWSPQKTWIQIADIDGNKVWIPADRTDVGRAERAAQDLKKADTPSQSTDKSENETKSDRHSSEIPIVFVGPMYQGFESHHIGLQIHTATNAPYRRLWLSSAYLQNLSDIKFKQTFLRLGTWTFTQSSWTGGADLNFSLDFTDGELKRTWGLGWLWGLKASTRSLLLLRLGIEFDPQITGRIELQYPFGLW